MPRLVVPDDFRIPAIVPDNGVSFIFGESQSAIVAIGKALATSRAGPAGDDRWLITTLPSGCVFFIHDRAAGKSVVATSFVVDRDR